MKAPDILKKAAQHMEDRAASRDQDGGERSMARTVTAFNALTGHQLSERDGWLFMAVLKAARACTTGTGLADDYEDGAAYFGLAGEAAHLVRGSVPANDNMVMPGDIVGGIARADGSVQVRIEGFDLATIPDGCKWIAQDWCGIWYAYPNRPQVVELCNYWGRGGNSVNICSTGSPNQNWRDTLRRVRA